MASNVMQCDFCGLEFTDLPDLLDHEEAHRACLDEEIEDTQALGSTSQDYNNPIESRPVIQPDFPLTVMESGKVNIEPIADHATKEFGCTQCPKIYKSKKALHLHVKSKHSSDTFHCSPCEKPFNTTNTFGCTQCPKIYQSKKALNLHVESKHSASTFHCSTCRKYFNNEGNRIRHEKVCKGQDHICSVCGKRCSTAGGLLRHQGVHKKVLTQPKPPMKRKRKSTQSAPSKKAKPALRRPGPSSYRCRRCIASFPDRHQLYLHGMQQHYQVGGGLQQRPWNMVPWEREDGTFDDDLREVYEANEPLILGKDQPGPIQSIYNFPVGNDVSVPQLNRFAAEIYEREQRAFKLNLSFGIILQHRETGQYRYFTPYRNNNVFDSPIYISRRTDLRRLYLRLRKIDILDQLLRNRPDTKWIPVLVTNVEFYVTGSNYPLGQGHLPDYLLHKHSLYPLVTNQSNAKPYKDNLCLFRCLALHRGYDIKCVDVPARDFYQTWKQQKKIKEPFTGVSFEDLPVFEKLFKVDLEVYSLEEDGEARSVYKSRARFENSMYVNMYENHMSYIKDFAMFAKKFRCRTCERHFDHHGNFVRHQKICTDKTKYIYPGGFHKSQDSIFQKLEAFDIHVPSDRRTFPWFVCYDFESLLEKNDDQPTPFLSWTQKHVPISVSVCSNVDEYTEPHCIIDPDQNKLTESMVMYMKEISDKVRLLSEDRWGWVLEDIDKLINAGGDFDMDLGCMATHMMDENSDTEDENEESDDEDENESENEDKKTLQNLYGQMEAYMSQIPVLAFNSAKYDLNLIKKNLARHLNMHEEKYAFVVKKNNAYACISCPQLKFLDMSQFLAAGSSYAGFLKAYGVEEQKGYFPYQWFDDVTKLENTYLPSHDNFYSELKQTNITEEQYAYCERIWKDRNMETFRDFLIWYNDLDVGPFVKAVKRFQKFYFDKGIDVFKSAISVPGIARQLLFGAAKEQNASFALCDRNNADLFHTIKHNVIGGPSIIFTRHHQAGKTRIRGDKLCKKIVGFDANALYLWAIDQPMPVGSFIRRLASNNFKPEVRDRNMAAYHWMNWLMKMKGIFIHHQQNQGSEIRIGKYPVDGFQKPVNDDDKAKIYQFHGCYWHGHQCFVTKNVKDAKWHEKREAKFQKTTKIGEYFKNKGFDLVEMWECQYRNYCRLNPKIYDFIESTRPGFFLKYKGKKVTESNILAGVVNEELFGMVEVDIEVPTEWPTDVAHPPDLLPYDYFKEMSPIFCTTEVPFESFGTHMQTHVEKHNLSKAPRRLLVGGMRARQILLTTPLLKWYIEKGLKVTKIYQLVEFNAQQCFRNFVNEVSNARRQGDKDPSTSMIADTMKVIGNSGYGSLIMDKTKHRDIKYIQGENKTCLKVNEPRFRKLECLDVEEQFYEVELAKSKTKLDLPIQLGYFILQYAKLRMLQFYYDFVDRYIDRSDFEYIEMDTDSAYMAISGSSIADVIKPTMKEKYDKGLEDYCHLIDVKADANNHWFPRTCCSKHIKYNKRTPGLFKLEYEGEEMIGLCSKTYIVRKSKMLKPSNTRIVAEQLLRKAMGSKRTKRLTGRRVQEYKFSSKGVNKRQIKSPMSIFRSVLQSGVAASVTNRGFRAKNNTIFTYAQQKRGFSYFYCKRRVANDGIHTTPLDIILCPIPPDNKDDIDDHELIQMLDNCFED